MRLFPRIALVSSIAALALAGASVAHASPSALPAAPGGTTTTTLTKLAESVPAVEPLYVGYTGAQQFIPAAVAAAKDARGCNLRQRMIISLATTKPKVGKRCRMKGGVWMVNGGTTKVTKPAGLVLQPVMDYKDAWGQGAYAWTPEQRLAWATNTGTGSSVRAKAVSYQATQGLFTEAWVNGVWNKFVEDTIYSANKLAESGTCMEITRYLSNARAWGLTVSPEDWNSLASGAALCLNVGQVSFQDMAAVYGIRPATGITTSPTVVPVADTPSGVRIFDGYGTPTGNPISTELFGLHAPVGYGTPGVEFGYLRVWDSDASWKDLEPSKGTYNWGPLEGSIANARGAKVMYVLGNTPGWANGGAGDAAPPANLADAADFIGAVCAKFGGQISSYEVWNEGNLLTFWGSGDMARLADLTQMIRDKVRACGSGAQVVASSAGARADGGFATRYKDYLTQLGARGWPVDAYSVHSYPTASGTPQQRVQELAQFKTMLALTGAPVKAVYDTELNYGLAGLGEGRVAISDEVGAGYLSQTYIQSVQYGVDSAFWYLWTAGNYDLLGIQFNKYAPQTTNAWGVTRSWLIGARMQRCGESGNVAACQFTESWGGNFTLAWATSGTADFDMTGIGKNCQSLQVGPCDVTGSTVKLGAQPVKIF